MHSMNEPRKKKFCVNLVLLRKLVSSLHEHLIMVTRATFGGGQGDDCAAFGREIRVFEFSHLRSTSSPISGSPLLAAVSLVKKMTYTVIS